MVINPKMVVIRRKKEIVGISQTIQQHNNSSHTFKKPHTFINNTHTTNYRTTISQHKKKKLERKREGTTN